MAHAVPQQRRPSDAVGVPVHLRDGGVATLRPLEHGESDVLLAVFEAMSSEARALRYLTGLHRLPAPMLTALTDVDGDRHIAWAAFVDGRPVGVARAVRLPGCPTTAELAFEVADVQHGRGLGAALVDAVTTAAAARGVRRVTASVAPDNTASRHLLDRLGLRGRFADGLLELEGPLRLLAPARVDRASVVNLACSSARSEVREPA